MIILVTIAIGDLGGELRSSIDDLGGELCSSIDDLGGELRSSVDDLQALTTLVASSAQA